MKILGNRVLISRIEDEKKEGFATVNVTDSFTYKGKIEQVGGQSLYSTSTGESLEQIREGDTVLFAKYSPDTQDVEHEGKKMKVVKVEDIIAIL
jgi:co-chaperonin GroES (HSP10)